MSQYLIDRIRSLPNIELHMDCEVNPIAGDPATGLTSATIHNRVDGSEQKLPLHHLFLSSAPIQMQAGSAIASTPTTKASSSPAKLLTNSAACPAVPCPPKPACRMSLPSAMSGPAQPNVLQQRLVRVQPSSRRSTLRSALRTLLGNASYLPERKPSAGCRRIVLLPGCLSGANEIPSKRWFCKCFCMMIERHASLRWCRYIGTNDRLGAPRRQDLQIADP